MDNHNRSASSPPTLPAPTKHPIHPRDPPAVTCLDLPLSRGQASKNDKLRYFVAGVMAEKASPLIPLFSPVGLSRLLSVLLCRLSAPTGRGGRSPGGFPARGRCFFRNGLPRSGDLCRRRVLSSRLLRCRGFLRGRFPRSFSGGLFFLFADRTFSRPGLLRQRFRFRGLFLSRRLFRSLLRSCLRSFRRRDPAGLSVDLDAEDPGEILFGDDLSPGAFQAGRPSGPGPEISSRGPRRADGRGAPVPGRGGRRYHRARPRRACTWMPSPGRSSERRSRRDPGKAPSAAW